MGSCKALVWVTFAAMSANPDTAHGDEPWIDLFNGENLEGWRPNVLPESWSVEDGAIRAHATRPYSHLLYVGSWDEDGYPRFDDFVLELEVKTEPSSNGGIFIHTDFDSVGAKNRLTRGLEVQINNTEKEKRKTGSLYQVVDLASSPVDETSWFAVRITTLDQRITIEVNDALVVDYTEPENVEGKPMLQPNGGAIALQAHDPDSVVYYRSIRVRRL